MKRNKSALALLLALVFSLSACSKAPSSPSPSAAAPSSPASPSAVVETPAPEAPQPITADVLVVGAGGAGMTAALRAAENGKQVVLIEKMAFPGGATAICGGAMVTTGSQLQRSLGVEGDTPESMVRDFLKNGDDLNDASLVTLYAQNVGATVDWLIDAAQLAFAESGIIVSPEYEFPRVVPFEGGAASLAQTLRTAAENAGVEILLETRAQHLLTENGAVTGVQATTPDGDLTILAPSVILATGGYGNNLDLLTEELQSALYYGPVSSTGDGVLMAREIGAGFQNMEYGKLYPNGVEVAPRIAKPSVNGSMGALGMNAILVDRNGHRVVDERAAFKEILAPMMAQSDHQLFLVMDQTSYNVFSQAVAGNGITQENLAAWLENAGSTPPLLVQGDTLEAVAEKAGVDGAALAETVARFNQFVAGGEDQDFGRSAEFMKMPLGTGPYYIIEQKPRFATTLGGVLIDTSMQVLSEDGSVISGLYAAGEVVGGIMGNDSPPGANVGWALTSGRLAGDAACR